MLGGPLGWVFVIGWLTVSSAQWLGTLAALVSNSNRGGGSWHI